MQKKGYGTLFKGAVFFGQPCILGFFQHFLVHSENLDLNAL